MLVLIVFITTDASAGLFCSECLREKVSYNQSNFKQETPLNSLEKSRGSGSRLHISISFCWVCPSLIKLCCNTDSLKVKLNDDTSKITSYICVD